MTLHELIQEYLSRLMVARGVAPNTAVSYRRALENLDAFCAEYRYGPTDLNELAIVNWLTSPENKGRAHRTHQQFKSVAAGFCDYLVRKGVLASNGARRVKLRRPGRTLPQIPSAEAIVKLLDSIDVNGGNPRELRDWLMIMIAWGCGLRVSELISLAVRQIDVEQRVIRVRGKGGVDQNKPFGDVILPHMQRQIASLAPGEIHLFPTRLRGPMTRAAFWKLLRERWRAAGLPAFGPHKLRHACGTALSDAGVDISAIKELLGHADVSTTQIYTHMSIKHLQAVHTRHPRASG